MKKIPPQIPQIETSWKEHLSQEFQKPYFKALLLFLEKERALNTIYPSPESVFRAFNLCPLGKVKVVILGQDPYHGIGQADGLCFSTHPKLAIPPSLKNILKEIKDDIRIDTCRNGDLTRWASQGVFLLNATLTVRSQVAGSHQNKGWEEFTDTVIAKLSQEREHLVFLLWGNYAKEKGVLIDKTKHLVLEAQHPSPLAVYRGFFGCKHFSRANAYLKKHGQKQIDWR
jgi:uracil-DNA glycosylase